MEVANSFEKQLTRIEFKIAQAKAIDSDFRVFGSGGHKYTLGPPLTEADVTAFERTYSLVLPQAYRLFITRIGNGGQDHDGAAGPYLGIFSLGWQLRLLVGRPEKYLNYPCRLFPGMSDAYWDNLFVSISSDELLTDEVYDDEMGRAFGGILPLGSQGCSFYHCLVLNGEHAGRVVNIDITLSKPRFSPDRNFLDWYERWLDEIISGKLRQLKPAWFGY